MEDSPPSGSIAPLYFANGLLELWFEQYMQPPRYQR